MKFYLSIVLFAIATAATAEEMDCLIYKYRYEDNFLKSDQVFKLYETEIEWRDFSSYTNVSATLHVEYPIARCEYVTKYDFRVVFVPNDTGTYEAVVSWRGEDEQAGEWKLYDFSDRHPAPFDISETLDKLVLAGEIKDLRFSWTTLEYTSHTLDFDLKREKTRYSRRIIPEIGAYFEVKDSIPAWECK